MKKTSHVSISFWFSNFYTGCSLIKYDSTRQKWVEKKENLSSILELNLINFVLDIIDTRIYSTRKNKQKVWNNSFFKASFSWKRALNIFEICLDIRVLDNSLNFSVFSKTKPLRKKFSCIIGNPLLIIIFCHVQNQLNSSTLSCQNIHFLENGGISLMRRFYSFFLRDSFPHLRVASYSAAPLLLSHNSLLKNATVF